MRAIIGEFGHDHQFQLPLDVRADGGKEARFAEGEGLFRPLVVALEG